MPLMIKNPLNGEWVQMTAPLREPISMPTANRVIRGILSLCVRERLHEEVPAEHRFAVTLPGTWEFGYPTRDAAENAIIGRGCGLEDKR